MTEKNSPRFTPLRISLLILFLAIPLVSIILGSGSDCSEFTAFPNARDRIRAQMHDPSSASFSNETAVSLGDCRYRVSGTVRGTNGFGGVVTEEFSVEVRG